MTTPNGRPLLKDLIAIPEAMSDSDLVLELSSGVLDAEATLRHYVITSSLVQNFDEALTLIKGAVTGQKSKAAYLHGSFGSGKSHFMAVLHALLRGEQAARRRNEFAKLLDKHDWLADKKFLLVPVHMLDAKSMEQKIFSTYISYVRKLHPDAPIPAVHRTDRLLEDVQRERAQYGDDQFIAGLPGGNGVAVNKWGKSAAGWTSAQLDQAIAAAPGDPLRERLVSDLLRGPKKAFFRDAVEDSQSYIGLTEGLKEISRHAKDLGYDSLVLFLDELVLWLITSAGDPQFVAHELKKVTLFVETGDPDRAAPIVSFIARQRDLREALGGEVAGASELEILDSLDLAKGRFDTIPLSDTNLPVIAQERVLKPLSPEAELRISTAFDQAKKLRTQIWDTLLGAGDGANAEAFRKTYPFSPAFLGTLVSLSAALQRSRTAIKLMMRLLINRREELRLGQLIPLGDLYDVLAEGGVEPFTQRLKTEFNAAQKLYQVKLRPHLLETYGLTEEQLIAVCRGDAADEGGRVKAFTGDDRLMKTLLLQALAPAEPALQNLTVSRLSALNHGAVTSMIPGQEFKMVASRVQGWASLFPEIKFTQADDPGVALELVGVDIDSILGSASTYNTPGSRKAMIRKLLYGELGVTETDQFHDRYDLVWRGGKRTFEVKFGNVADPADLPDDMLLPDDASTWRIVLDYPFDVENRGPADDRLRMQQLRDRGVHGQTVAWLPATLSAERMRDLGNLAVIDYVLTGQRFEEHAAGLNPTDRHRAKQVLTAQRDVLTGKLTDTLRQAYGLVTKQQADIVGGYDDHLEPLDETLQPRLASGASLAEAMRHLADQMLAAQFPGAPKFDRTGNNAPIKVSELRTVLKYVRTAAEQAPNPVDVATGDRPTMTRIANELLLGEMHEAKFQLGTYWRQHFNAEAARDGVADDISIQHLLKWIDKPDPRGLEGPVANLIIAAWAEQTDRAFVERGGVLSEAPDLNQIKPSMTLHEQQLPDQDTWDRAMLRAYEIFGHPPVKFRRARLATMAAGRLSADSREFRDAARDLVVELENRRDLLGLELEAREGRLHTARVAEELLDQLGSQHGKLDIIAALANVRFDSEATTARLGKSIKSAREVADALGRANWTSMQQSQSLPTAYQADATRIMAELQTAARVDQLTSPLKPALDRAGKAASALVQRMLDDQKASLPVVDEPQVDVPVVIDQPGPGPDAGPAVSGRAVYAVAELAGLVEQLGREHPGKKIEIQWRVIG